MVSGSRPHSILSVTEHQMDSKSNKLSFEIRKLIHFQIKTLKIILALISNAVYDHTICYLDKETSFLTHS